MKITTKLFSNMRKKAEEMTRKAVKKASDIATDEVKKVAAMKTEDVKNGVVTFVKAATVIGIAVCIIGSTGSTNSAIAPVTNIYNFKITNNYYYGGLKDGTVA